MTGFGFFDLEKPKKTPIQKREIVLPEPSQEENSIADEFLEQRIFPTVENCQYIQGQDKCPVCEGIVNYIFSMAEGFIQYECSNNDCLPWPVGGAMKRREVGLPQIVPTRYEE